MQDIRLSVSKTKTFLGCKKQFEFSYNLKLPKKDREYHTFGKFCHKALEDFHQAYISGCDMPYHIVMGNAFKAAKEEFKDKMTPEMKKECWELINTYLKNISIEDNLVKNVLSVEKKFEVPISNNKVNVILNGMIDKIQIDADNVLHVADYKTTKNKKYLKDDWFQLMTYGFVMLNEDPKIKKIRASYILLRHDFEYITKEFNVEELMSVKDQYLKYAEEIVSEKEFKANPTPLCSYCDFLDKCPEGMQSVSPMKKFGEVSW